MAVHIQSEAVAVAVRGSKPEQNRTVSEQNRTGYGLRRVQAAAYICAGRVEFEAEVYSINTYTWFGFIWQFGLHGQMLVG